MTDKLPSAKFPPYLPKDAVHRRTYPPTYGPDGIDDSMPISTVNFNYPYLGGWGTNNAPQLDRVNHPPHYTKGKYEAIDVIEDAVQFAPDSVIGGLQWQALKYILRMWHKDKALEDAKKAQWYLTRLIETLEKQ